MTEKINRREFLKVVGLGAATTTILTGCGPASRHVARQPYFDMPEYTLPGKSTYFATTCRECPAGCGLVVRTVEGRAVKIEGNPNHPISRGRTCPRGQATLQGLYNPDRIEGPGKQAERGMGSFEPLVWDDAIQVVKDALTKNKPEEIAFLMGLESDHLFALVQEIALALGADAPLRFGALGMVEGRNTMMEAARIIFGERNIPTFDIEQAEVTFSFGANFSEAWLSPVSYTHAYGVMRQGHPGQRGYLVQFEARMSQTAAIADEWIPIVPGTEGLVAQALGYLVAELNGGAIPNVFAEVDVPVVAEASGITEDELRRLAGIFAGAQRRVAIPGGLALGHTNGLDTAKAIFALNAVADNLGKPGGLFFTPAPPVHEDLNPGISSFGDLGILAQKMNRGEIKALFIHGANPAYELPQALGFANALENVPLVISFASFPDETAQLADYVLPDHTGLESWGYQRTASGGDRLVISGAQPVVVPLHDTRATADVLLAAVQMAGGSLAQAVSAADEVEYLQNAVGKLIGQPGIYPAFEINTFWSRWQQYGGWWGAEPGLPAPSAAKAAENLQKQNLVIDPPAFSGEEERYEFHLVAYPAPNLGDGRGANRPWLQETPDPMTTVMWGSWVEINPQTAHHLGLKDDDVVKITSPVGEVEAVVYLYPAIRPDTIAIPIGQGHTALGRYAEGRGCNPIALLDLKLTQSGDLAHAATRVRIQRTGRHYKLARMESRAGVYGEGHG